MTVASTASAAPADLGLVYQKVEVPEGRRGDWSIERFVIRDQGAASALAAPHDVRPQWVRAEPGEYTRLRHRGVDFMSDLYEEWHSQLVAMQRAVQHGGDVLITGLGLGMVVDAILRAPSSIRSVTVLDASEEVIELVGPHLRSRHSDRLRVLHADAFTWRPASAERFTTVWHDIWPNPFLDSTVEESHELFTHYEASAAWQGSWALEYRRLAGLDGGPSAPVAQGAAT